MTIRLHGTWEEIAARAEEFRGKPVTLTVYDHSEKLLDPNVVDAFFDELGRTKFEPPPRDRPDPYGDYLAEKYRKQGLDF